MRAKGPKAKVSSVRVGPCQASAIEPPRETVWQGRQSGGSTWHRNDRREVKRQTAAGKTVAMVHTRARTRHRIVRRVASSVVRTGTL